VGYALLILTLLILAVTFVFNHQFEVQTRQVGSGHWRLQISDSQLPGYAVVFCYILVMGFQTVAMLLYRLSIIVYKACQYAVDFSALRLVTGGEPAAAAAAAAAVPPSSVAAVLLSPPSSHGHNSSTATTSQAVLGHRQVQSNIRRQASAPDEQLRSLQVV